VPRTRGGHRTQLFERYARRRPELDEAIAGMFIKGVFIKGVSPVSTRGVGEVMESLTGQSPSASTVTVSRVFHIEGVPHAGGGVPGMEGASSLP
jgi:transposase-like protein